MMFGGCEAGKEGKIDGSDVFAGRKKDDGIVIILTHGRTTDYRPRHLAITLQRVCVLYLDGPAKACDESRCAIR
jgi:hypothetical protein